MDREWNEVDGVTTLSAPAGAIQGPLQACLVFGVGRADETILVSGITHVVEHLAFQPLGHRPHWFNGSVSTVCTRFMASGGPDDVAEFFDAICKSLSDIPVDRLDQELQILRVEEQRAGTSHFGMDLSHRFGPRGVGLVGWPEHGLKRVGREDVIEWARTWFTAENAALWTSGPLPANLDLSALPRGSAPPHNPLQPSCPPARAFAVERVDLVSVSAVMERQPGVGPVLQVAYRRAFDRLRREHALSYGIAVECERLDAGHSLAYLGADGTEGNYTQVFERLVAVWDELAESGPTEAEWRDMHRMYLTHRESPQFRLNNLDDDAERQVLGLPFVPEEEFSAKVAALTPDEVRNDVAAIASTRFGVVPLEVADGAAGWSLYEPWSFAPVDGDPYHPIDEHEEGTLVVGSHGVSWVADDDRARTVRWDDAVCCFTWDDGRRSLQSPTGEWVFVVPWCWRGGHHLTERIDTAIEPERRIRLGEGETLYLLDPNDPNSTTDVHWLGSVVGAVYRDALVDLVIDTDGFFVLFSGAPTESLEARFQHLGRGDRLTLLGTDSRNRWVPQRDIEIVELTKRRRFHGARQSLVIHLRDGTTMIVDLKAPSQAETVSKGFGTMLGPNYQE